MIHILSRVPPPTIQSSSPSSSPPTSHLTTATMKEKRMRKSKKGGKGKKKISDKRDSTARLENGCGGKPTGMEAGDSERRGGRRGREILRT